jgi:hypothetical protein
MIGTIAAEMAKRHGAGQHKHKPSEMREKLVLRFLGLGEARQYNVEQSQGIPPFVVGLAITTLEEKDPCGYLSAKTVPVL